MGSALLGWVFFHFSHFFRWERYLSRFTSLFFGTAPSTRTFSETRINHAGYPYWVQPSMFVSICLMIFGLWLVYANKRSGDLQEPRLFVFLCDLARSEV